MQKCCLEEVTTVLVFAVRAGNRLGSGRMEEQAGTDREREEGGEQGAEQMPFLYCQYGKVERTAPSMLLMSTLCRHRVIKII